MHWQRVANWAIIAAVILVFAPFIALYVADDPQDTISQTVKDGPAAVVFGVFCVVTAAVLVPIFVATDYVVTGGIIVVSLLVLSFSPKAGDTEFVHDLAAYALYLGAAVQVADAAAYDASPPRLCIAACFILSLFLAVGFLGTHWIGAIQISLLSLFAVHLSMFYRDCSQREWRFREVNTVILR